VSDLRNRARTNGSPNGSQVATRGGSELKEQIRRMEEQFQLAMPKGVEAKQLIRDALTVMSANPKLGDCDRNSVLGALMTCAQLGLRPGVLGQAWVIPFKGKGQLVIGYQGLVALAQRSGDIASISARIVYQNDVFEFEYGLNERLVHRPTMEDPGPAVAYYCVVKSTKGGVYWEVLTVRGAQIHRDKFAMARNREGQIFGPWVDHFDQMALKTAVKKALNLAPRSTELVQAMTADETIRVNLAPDADISATVVDVPSGMPDGQELVHGEVADEGFDIPPGYDPSMEPGYQAPEQ
jgi:recombination protein RecT